MALEISSTKNPRIKKLIALQKPKERKEQQIFAVEGVREISLAQQSGFEIIEAYIYPAIYQQDQAYPILIDGVEVYEITKEVFSKIAYREISGGIIAVATAKKQSLEQLPAGDNPLYLVLESVEKPGNIGAMLRTADAAGLSGVIVCDPSTDFYNPNVVRSSIGCLFTVPVAACTNEELMNWVRHKNIRTYAAALSGRAKAYHEQDYTGPAAFLLGAESTGLSDFWMQHADKLVIIPMKGKIDSMNVSNAAAVLIFEAVRQRGC